MPKSTLDLKTHRYWWM